HGPQRKDRDAGGNRLVEVHEVETTPLHPPAHPGSGPRPERQPSHGTVVAPRNRTARADDIVRQRSVLVGRSQDADVVALADEVLGEVADVQLHSPGHVEGVRADDPDPHELSPAFSETCPDTPPSSRSLVNTRCIMCQSSVCSRTSRVSTSAPAWAIARLLSR